MRNMMRENRDLVVALDIGTSKIAVLVAEPSLDGGFNVIRVVASQIQGADDR